MGQYSGTAAIGSSRKRGRCVTSSKKDDRHKKHLGEKTIGSREALCGIAARPASEAMAQALVGQLVDHLGPCMHTCSH